MRKIYEDERVKISSTGKDYDFIATIENKTDEAVAIVPDIGGLFEEIFIEPNDWVGLLADEDGRNTLNALKKGRFLACPKKLYEEEFCNG